MWLVRLTVLVITWAGGAAAGQRTRAPACPCRRRRPASRLARRTAEEGQLATPATRDFRRRGRLGHYLHMPVIVVTRLRLRDPALLDEFFTDAVAAIE